MTGIMADNRLSLDAPNTPTHLARMLPSPVEDFLVASAARNTPNNRYDIIGSSRWVGRFLPLREWLRTPPVVSHLLDRPIDS